MTRSVTTTIVARPTAITSERRSSRKSTIRRREYAPREVKTAKAATAKTIGHRAPLLCTCAAGEAMLEAAIASPSKKTSSPKRLRRQKRSLRPTAPACARAPSLRSSTVPRTEGWKAVSVMTPFVCLQWGEVQFEIARRSFLTLLYDEQH